MEVTCPGWCCYGFTMSVSPQNLREAAQRVPVELERATYAIDARIIADMVIPLGPHPIDGQASYTCKWWDPKTKLCGVYERRPMMCRLFPEGEPCEFGCGVNGYATRYIYLGDKLTDPRLKGKPCDPVRRADGKCIVGRGNQLVKFVDGRRIAVNRRRLRVVNPAL